MTSIRVSIASFFQHSFAQFCIATKKILCESHNSLGVGECYYDLLKLIYKKLKLENPDLDKNVTLSIALHGLNSTENTEKLVPTLLVFGS